MNSSSFAVVASSFKALSKPLTGMTYKAGHKSQCSFRVRSQFFMSGKILFLNLD